MVLTYIFLLTNVVEYLFMLIGHLGYLFPRRNACSSLVVVVRLFPHFVGVL